MKKTLIGLVVLACFGLIVWAWQSFPPQSGQASLFVPKVYPISESSLEYGQYTAVLDESKVFWEGKKLVGGGHEGFVPLKSGKLNYQKGETAGKFVLDMSALKATDTDSQKLVNHLKAEDFFDAKAYPESVFVVQGLYSTEEGLFLAGTLQVKALAIDVQFPVEVTEEGETVHFSGTVTLDRKDLQIGNPMLSDDIPVTIDILLERQDV